MSLHEWEARGSHDWTKLASPTLVKEMFVCVRGARVALSSSRERDDDASLSICLFYVDRFMLYLYDVVASDFYSL